MPTLPDKANLHDYQHYVQQWERELGLSDQSTMEKCLLLGEELGELFKAVRKHEGTTKATAPVAEALADMMLHVCAIANQLDIDLDKAFRDKEEKNRRRRWGNVM